MLLDVTTRTVGVARRRFRVAVGARLLRLLVLVTLLAPACSKKSPDPLGVMVDPVVDNIVTWTTSEARIGSVRYGYTRNGFDHMAYPIAAGRRDKQLLTRHEVALLDLQVGRMLYFQVVNETATGARDVSPLDSMPVGNPLGRSLLTATMIHIGFGDSHLVTMPNGKRLLIDGGYSEAASSVAQYFAEHGVNAVDAMLATHNHGDHIGGIVGRGGNDMSALLRMASPSVYFDTPQQSGNFFYHDAVLAHIAATSTRLVVLERGDSPQTVPELNLDPAVGIRILNSGRLPAPPYGDRETDQINNDSMVLRFSYMDVDFIIGGDALVEAENSMMAAFPGPLEVEYYKAQHHGLSNASSSAWVSRLNPRVAFIPNTSQVWNPPPTFESAISSTVRKLNTVGAHVYVIDEAEALGVYRGSRQYNVTFATDGLNYEVRLEWATQTTPNKLSAEALECMMGGHATPGDTVSPVSEEQP